MALGIRADGSREILGFWIFGSEGKSAKSWEEVLRELKRRDVKRIELFITDDLPRIEEAIKMVYSNAGVRLKLCLIICKILIGGGRNGQGDL